MSPIWRWSADSYASGPYQGGWIYSGKLPSDPWNIYCWLTIKCKIFSPTLLGFTCNLFSVECENAGLALKTQSIVVQFGCLFFSCQQDPQGPLLNRGTWGTLYRCSRETWFHSKIYWIKTPFTPSIKTPFRGLSALRTYQWDEPVKMVRGLKGSPQSHM